jgi:hypothetical protein
LAIALAERLFLPNTMAGRSADGLDESEPSKWPTEILG